MLCKYRKNMMRCIFKFKSLKSGKPQNVFWVFFSPKYFLFHFSIQVLEQGSGHNHGSLGYWLPNWLQC